MTRFLVAETEKPTNVFLSEKCDLQISWMKKSYSSSVGFDKTSEKFYRRENAEKMQKL